MKVFVDKDICIGCGACQAICPNLFTIDDDGLAKVIDNKVPDQLTDDAKDAVENCPVGAIADSDESIINVENVA